MNHKIRLFGACCFRDSINKETLNVHSIGFETSVILGKTRSFEFAAGAHNISHPIPWNPFYPNKHFFKNLDPEVQDGFDNAISRLKTAGVIFEPIELPEAEEAGSVFAGQVPYDLVNTLGRERFLSGRNEIDPTVFNRLSPALDLSEETTEQMRCRLGEISKLGARRLKGLDGFISPMTPLLPKPVTSCYNVKQASKFTGRVLQNSRPANIYNFCPASLPISRLTNNKPVGLQVHMVSGKDADLLSLCRSIELFFKYNIPKGLFDEK